MPFRFPTERHLEKIDERDKFKYKELSAHILDQVLLQMETPNCLGIYGNWGSGKSTILHFLQGHISQRVESESNTNLIPVYFEPWKYEYAKGGDLVFALLRKIESALPNKSKATFQKLWKRVGASLLTVGTWSLRTGTNLASLGQCEVDPRAIAEDMSYYERLLEPNNAWVDEMEGFRERFETAIDKGLPEGKTLLVLIDDLDRCLPENAVNLIEALKNFLNAKRTLFVVAVDKRVISDMVQKKYGLHDGYGEEYLMKVLPYFFELPRVEVATIVKEACATFAIPSDESLQKYFTDFMRRFAIEPRKTKYYLHQFGMRFALGGQPLKHKLQERYNQSDTQQGSRLADFFLLSFIVQRFPRIFTQEHPEQALLIVRARALDPNSSFKDSRQVEAMLSASDWNIITRVLSFGYWQNTPGGNPVSPTQIQETFPMLNKYVIN